MQAPTIRAWYTVLERLVPASLSAGRQALAKVALDQMVFAVGFQASFVSILGTLQGLDAATVRRKLEAELKDVLLANWKVTGGESANVFKGIIMRVFFRFGPVSNW